MVVGVTSQFPWPPHLCPGLWHCLLPSLLFCFRGFHVWVDGGSIFPDSQAANLGRPLGLHCHSLHLTCQFLSSKYISTLPTSHLPPPPLLCPSGPVPVPCPLLSPLPSYAGSNARARVTLIQNGGRTQLMLFLCSETPSGYPSGQELRPKSLKFFGDLHSFWLPLTPWCPLLWPHWCLALP